MNITPKQRTLAITMLIAVVLLGWLLWPSQPPKAMLTAQVTREDIAQTVLASGVLQAVENGEQAPDRTEGDMELLPREDRGDGCDAADRQGQAEGQSLE